LKKYIIISFKILIIYIFIYDCIEYHKKCMALFKKLYTPHWEMLRLRYVRGELHFVKWRSIKMLHFPKFAFRQVAFRQVAFRQIENY